MSIARIHAAICRRAEGLPAQSTDPVVQSFARSLSADDARSLPAGYWLSREEPMGWREAPAIGALGRSLTDAGAEPAPPIAQLVARRARECALDVGSGPHERLAWRRALQQVGWKPPRDDVLASLAEVSAFERRSYHSGWITDGEYADAEASAVAGSLGIIVGLHLEMPTISSWATEVLSRIADCVATDGALVWQHRLEGQYVLWAILGLALAGRMARRAALSDAAVRMADRFERDGLSGRIDGIPERAFMSVADAWSEVERRVLSASGAAGTPVPSSPVGWPDAAAAMAVGTDRAFGWWWQGRHAPMLAGSMPGGGRLEAGPCHARDREWCLSSGRPSWEQVVEIEEVGADEDGRYMWSGAVALSDDGEGPDVMHVPALGAITPEAAGLFLNVARASSSRLAWRVSVADQPDSRLVIDRDRAAWVLPGGEGLYLRWTPGRCTITARDAGELVIGPPFPSTAVLGAKEAVDAMAADVFGMDVGRGW